MLADFEFNKAPLCEGMILACEQSAAIFPRKMFTTNWSVSLSGEGRNQPASAFRRAVGKTDALFYGDWGFKASRGVYRLSVHYGWTRC